MAHFYADIQGNRGQATRMGTKNSGIGGHIRGWDIGATVHCSHRDGKDIVSVNLTRGSNGGTELYLGQYIVGSNGAIRKLKDTE